MSERLLLTVQKGALVPGDPYTAKRLRERGYKVGDNLLAELRKPRSPGFHRLAHQLGVVIGENVDELAGLDGHAVLKRLQIEANVECDSIPVNLEILGQKIKVQHRIPKSLSWASMDEGKFRETIRALCDYVALTYWPSLTPEQVEQMALMMPESA